MFDLNTRRILAKDTTHPSGDEYHQVDVTYAKDALGDWAVAPRKYIKVAGVWTYASWPRVPVGGVLTINEKDIGAGRLEYGMDIGSIPVEGSITGDDAPVDDMHMHSIRIRAAATAKAFVLIEFSYQNGHTPYAYEDFPTVLNFQMLDAVVGTPIDLAIPRVDNVYGSRVRYQLFLDDNSAYNYIRTAYLAGRTIDFVGQNSELVRRIGDPFYTP